MVGRRALVTGATGGLGRIFVPMLRAAGWSVDATGRRPRPDDDIRAIDLTRRLPRGLLDGVDTVFHLAALSAPWGRHADFLSINRDATRDLARAATTAGCRRFVHVSTPSIYAEARDRLSITERDSPARRFANSYAETKWLAEEAVRAAGISASIVRPRAIVSPYDTVLLPRLLRAMRKPRVPLPGGGRALFELIDARDVGRALIAAADAAPATVNISSGEPRTVRAMMERIGQSIGLTPRFVSVPRRVALASAGLLEVAGRATGREPIVTRYGIKVLGWSQTFDLSHARAALGWEPEISPEEAIDHALAHRCDA